MGVKEITRQLVADAGWQPGTSLENKVAWTMHRWGLRSGWTPPKGRNRTNHDVEAVAQQHTVGKYRLDFAWPDFKLGLEADGWWHRSPEGAARDAERDSDLRTEGWLIFRVDDRHGEDALERQLAEAVRAIRIIIHFNR